MTDYDPLLYSCIVGFALFLFISSLGFWSDRLMKNLQEAEDRTAKAGTASFWSGTSWRPAMPLIMSLAPYYSRFEKSETAANVIRNLNTLGNPLRLSFAHFLAICHVSAAGLGAVLALIGVLMVVSLGSSIAVAVAFTVLGLVLGWALPWYYLYSDASAKVTSIGRDLSFALDLMFLVIEAGGSVQEAFDAVVEEGSFGPLREELSLVRSEVEHGSTLGQALESFAGRVPSDELIIVVQAITQGLEFGTPLGEILHGQADLIRLKRTERAEKIAKKAGSQMIFPVVLIMFATFLLILGPAIIQFRSSSLF